MTPSQDDRARYWLLGDLGLVLLAMGDAPGAARLITEALQTVREKGWGQQVCEANIGLAACALARGQLDEARTYVHEAWDFLKEHGWFGLGNPSKTYRICIDTFEALGETEQVAEVLEIAHQILVDYAN